MTELPITEPGVYDIPEDAYHADPVEGGSLSSSGARRLLATCPARFRYELDNPRPSTRAMELGTAAHRLVLGVGPGITVIDAPNYRTKAAQEARDEVRAAGGVPLLRDEWDVVEQMAAKLREHELASVLLGGAGLPEQTLVWRDGPTGVWCRARLDWLPTVGADRQMYLADYKTARSAHLDAISRAVEERGYHAQAAWYESGVLRLGLADRVFYYLVVQEKEPPYLVSVVRLNLVAMDAGRHLNRRALEIYAQCRDTGYWPPYAEGAPSIGLPPWAENRFLQEVTS